MPRTRVSLCQPATSRLQPHPRDGRAARRARGRDGGRFAHRRRSDRAGRETRARVS